MNGINRRKYPRKAFKKTLTFLTAGLSEVTQGVEIGEGGLSFSTDLILKVDDQLVVNFFIPQGDFFSVRSTVKNIIPKKDGKIVYGVAFNIVEVPLKRQIRAYVARTINDQIIVNSVQS